MKYIKIVNFRYLNITKKIEPTTSLVKANN